MSDTFNYVDTHQSVLDDSPAMRVSEASGKITLVNEDGYIWTDPSEQWRPIADAEDPRIARLREILVSMRDDAVLVLANDRGDEACDHETYGDETAAQSTLDAYHGVARAFDLLDESSSASRQHYIDTGAYLLTGEEL